MISPLSDHPVTKRYIAAVGLTIDAALIVDEQAGGGGVTLESGRPEAYKLDLNYQCNNLYSNNNSIGRIFADTVIINGYAFVLSQPKHSSEALHNSIAVHRLTWDKDDNAWHDWVQVAKDSLLAAGQIDVVGRDSCFLNTPRNMAMLPHSKAHVVVVANADNNALRYMDVPVPVESQDNDMARLVRMLTVGYDKDLGPALNQGNIPRTTNASKRCHF
jgi:hypothetical protein